MLCVKNIPDIIDYNLKKSYLISIVFGILIFVMQ